jgi:hypothetical protein
LGVRRRHFITTFDMSIRLPIVRREQWRICEVAQCRRLPVSGNSAEAVVRYSVVFGGVCKMSAREYEDLASWVQIGQGI